MYVLIVSALSSTEICNECHPYLNFNGIGAFSVEVFQWEVLLDLLEKQLNLPSLAVNGYNVFRG